MMRDKVLRDILYKVIERLYPITSYTKSKFMDAIIIYRQMSPEDRLIFANTFEESVHKDARSLLSSVNDELKMFADIALPDMKDACVKLKMHQYCVDALKVHFNVIIDDLGWNIQKINYFTNKYEDSYVEIYKILYDNVLTVVSNDYKGTFLSIDEDFIKMYPHVILCDVILNDSNYDVLEYYKFTKDDNCCELSTRLLRFEYAESKKHLVNTMSNTSTHMIQYVRSEIIRCIWDRSFPTYSDKAKTSQEYINALSAYRHMSEEQRKKVLKNIAEKIGYLGDLSDSEKVIVEQEISAFKAFALPNVNDFAIETLDGKSYKVDFMELLESDLIFYNRSNRKSALPKDELQKEWHSFIEECPSNNYGVMYSHVLCKLQEMFELFYGWQILYFLADIFMYEMVYELFGYINFMEYRHMSKSDDDFEKLIKYGDMLYYK